jgi:haloalkane dehalogenase
MSEREVPPWVPGELFPFESRFVEVNGHRLHYVDEGGGPALLLLHGNPTWSFLYRNVIAGLSNRFRCVAPDYPGFGLSRAADGYDHLPASHARIVAAFVERLGLTELTVMGQDWGGPIGLWVAERRPEDVRALILGNTWAWPVDGDAHFERFSKTMGGEAGRLAIRHLNAFVNLMIPLGVKRRRLDRRVMTAYRRALPTAEARMPTYVFPREILGSRAFLAEVRDGLRVLSSKPALIVWGDRDIAFRASEREELERIFTRHKTVILRGAGHFIQEDAPDAIAEAVRGWWHEVE